MEIVFRYTVLFFDTICFRSGIWKRIFSIVNQLSASFLKIVL